MSTAMELPRRVPLARMRDGSELSEWVFTWSHGKDAMLRAAVFDAGRRLREYKIPIYIIDTDDEEALRTIFHRVNNSGKPLTWSEVHDALYGHKGDDPSSLHELADQLEQLGMGRPDEDSQRLLPSTRTKSRARSGCWPWFAVPKRGPLLRKPSMRAAPTRGSRCSGLRLYIR